MALTRRFLSAQGIEGDKADEIIAAHVEVTDALKEERDRYKALAEKAEALEAEAETLRKGDGYKEKYEALKREYDDYRTQTETGAIHRSKEAAYRQLLKSAGISEKRIDAVLKVSDVDSLELAEDGTIVDADKRLEAIKSEWSDFIVSEGTLGADTPPSTGSTGGSTMTKAEIMAIRDTSARQKAIAENHELFGI